MSESGWSSARRMVPLFSTVLTQFDNPNRPPTGAVRLREVVDDPTPPIMHYDPGNPDADKDGFVAYPAINPTTEMVDLMGAVRGYQLNASAVTASKQMIQESIDILKTS